MKLTADYHTHTPYSHGKNTVFENVSAAKKAGLTQIGITDHGFNHLLFGLKRKKLNDLRREIDEAERLTGVKVLMGMESNLISVDGDTDMKESDLQYFDLYLAGLVPKEITAKLGITENTIKYHNKNIYGKLGVKSRKELLQCVKYMRLLERK